jgi:uncharacterized membrane-anchored protein
MQIGDLVQIVSNDRQLKMLGMVVSLSDYEWSCKLMYDGGKVADFDLRFWKINVIA